MTKCTCPKCGTGTATSYDRVAKCRDPDYTFHPPYILDRWMMTDEDMIQLMAREVTSSLKLTTRAGKPYEASLRMGESYKVELMFKGKRSEG